jgi:phosphorylcholine metabolism protein LicD
MPCTRDTQRCEFWNDGDNYLRPHCCTDHLRELLFFTEDLLTRNGIFHWLDYGSLLGAVRDQALIPWDSDIDWGILRKDMEKVRALESDIAAAGYWLDTSQPDVWRINFSRLNTQHVDLYPWWEQDGLMKMNWMDSSPDQWAFPTRWLNKLEPVDLLGRTFPAPSPVHEFLAKYRYGPDYLTPRRPEAEANSRGVDQLRKSVDGLLMRREQTRVFEQNLVLLHDLLQDSPVGDRYWMIGGLLIGCIREGRVLPHDSRDADFGFLREDREHLLASIRRLTDAGFHPLYCYRNNAGHPVEHSFRKDGALFEFFEHHDVQGCLRYWTFGTPANGEELGVEVISQVAAYDLAPVEFLGRTWQKPADHEAYLDAIYGNWTEPNPAYNCIRDDLSIVEQHPWTVSRTWTMEDNAGNQT